MPQRSVAFRADTAMVRPRWNLEPEESDDEPCGPSILAMRFFFNVLNGSATISATAGLPASCTTRGKELEPMEG